MNSDQEKFVLDGFRLGITCSEQLFKLLEENARCILTGDLKAVNELNSVFQKVEKATDAVTVEKGRNFGKSIEVILESSGYSPRDSSALGILKQVQISRHLGFCSLVTLNRVTRCLASYGFSTRLDLRRPAVISAQNRQKMAMILRIGEFDLVEVNDLFISLVLESQISVIPSGPIHCTVTVPGSKSISNRVLLMAALGHGTCAIEGLLDSDDIVAMLKSLEQLGVKFEWTQGGQRLVVYGSGGKFKQPEQPLYLNNSGTSARFLTSAACLVQSENENTGKCRASTILTGNARMQERPIGPLVSALQSNGCEISYLGNVGCLPISVGAKTFSGGKVFIEGKVSSQYVSSILISAPYAQTPLTLQLAEENPVSLPYILMTVKLMQDFGIPVKFLAPNEFQIPKGVYSNPAKFVVEPDASSATYLLAMAAITGGDVTVRHLGSQSLQGDAKFYEALAAMGCDAVQTELETRVRGPTDKRLRSVKVNMETLTDAFMTIAVLAAVAEGKTEIRGIANQRVKECNRIAVMVEELTKLGIDCGELEDGLWIEGIQNFENFKTPAYINCHDDHRIALSFAVLGSRIPGIVILDKECTSKTYPGFWDDCRAIQVSLCPGSRICTANQNPSSIFSTNQNYPPTFLVGMRGCGKTTFGKLAASALGLSFLCMDQVLETQFGESISCFVEEHGWTEFRAEEERLLRRLVEAHPVNTIVSCGGGVVETPGCLDLLGQCLLVINIERPWEEVKFTLLQPSDSRPELPEQLEIVWNRRRPLYKKCSRYEFRTSFDNSAAVIEKSTQDFIEFLEKLLANHKQIA